MARISDLTVDQLYEKIETDGKVTPSVLKALQAKESFTHYGRYFDIVCDHPGKLPVRLAMETEKADVLIIQNHIPFPEKYKRGSQLDALHRNQFASMMDGDVTYRIVNLMKAPPELFRNAKGKWMNKFTMTQMKTYMPYLLNEIEHIQPKVIVSTSTEITKLLGIKKSNAGAKGNRGEVHMSPLLDIPVVLTLHPRFLNMIRQQASGGMWGDDYYPVIRRDLSKACGLATGRIELKDLDEALDEVAQRITVCRSMDDVRKWSEVLMDLPPNTVTSWDLETTSLDPWSEDSRILTSQVGYRMPDGLIHNLVFPLWHRDNTGYDADEAFKIHSEYLLRDSFKVGHNITFDICFLAVTTGVRLQGTILDTLLALHSLDSGISGCMGLKTAVWDYLLESGLGGYEACLQYED